ncbi:MAG: DUF899 family protein [candidate division Zixibacteria bacterium]|nr:DUF899 family protein [candidate division Zixibacteria bacterium]
MKQDNSIRNGELMKAYSDLERAKARILELRQAVPELPVADYTFKTISGEPVTHSSLFQDKSELMIIHNMGKGCSYCTVWADGFNGLVPHLENRVPFAVISPNAPDDIKSFSESRGWLFSILSAQDSTFAKDMGFASEKNEPWPGVSTFCKDDSGKMYRVNAADFGPGDDYCALWHLFDLLPSGKGDWEPKYVYEQTLKLTRT